MTTGGASVPRPDGPGTIAPGVIAVYSDVVCPWATVVVERLRHARDEAGADVVLDLRPLPLELLNEAPVPFDITNEGATAAASLLPDYGFSPRERAEDFPVTSLLALEAVRAAYEQSPGAAEALDGALRRAFFVDHRCISLHHEIVDIAAGCEDVDARRLDDRLRSGRSRCDVFEHLDTSRAMEVQGSPHVFLADGTDAFLPSIELGEDVEVVSDEPGAIAELVRRAAMTRQAD